MAKKKATTAPAQGETRTDNTTTESSLKAYNVRVTAAAANIRSGAGDTFAIVAMAKQGDVFGITNSERGYGRLANGLGWIKLAYTERI